MWDSGVRIGEALGLRHEDIVAAEPEVTVVPRVNACTSPTVSTRGSFSGAFSATARAGPRLAPGQVMQEGLPPAPAIWHLPGGQQLPDIHAMPHLMLIERGQRRQLPVDRRRTDV
jgi:hypothetical protein